MLVSNGSKTLSDKTTSCCSLVDLDTDTGKPLIAASLESCTLKDNELQASRDDRNLSCLEKDLSSTIEDSHFNEENASLEVSDQTLSMVNDKGGSCDYEVPERSKDDTKKSEIQGMPKITGCHSFENQHPKPVDIALPEMGGNECSLQQRVDNEVVGRVENLNGECTSMAPPYSDVFSKCEIDDSRHNKSNYVSQGIGQVLQKSTNETFCRNNGQGQGHDSQDSSPKNKMVPNPNLHLKLSKISGSFNYRRLLPYLTDITSPNSGAYVVAATPTSSSNRKPTQSPPKQVAESAMIIDSQQEPGPLVKPSALDTCQKSETRPKDVVESPDMSSSSRCEEGSNRLPLETEEDCMKCANHERQIEADSYVEASIPHEIPSAGLRKGILKRNPRGCRGICTCLDCSSFRLHAERSFEFSRNQMQDVQEVALDLMKELSYLRNMSEKSAFVAKDQATIRIDKVKEAIKKASDSEELAKTRS